jgi:hypothetical protein
MEEIIVLINRQLVKVITIDLPICYSGEVKIDSSVYNPNNSTQSTAFTLKKD